MKTLFAITLIVELIFALGFLAVPGMMFNTFGVTPDALGMSLIRTLGSALLSFVVLLWFGRSSDNSEVHRAILVSMLTYWLVSSVLMLTAQLAGLFNAMGWGVILMHFGFSIAYAYFIFKK